MNYRTTTLVGLTLASACAQPAEISNHDDGSAGQALRVFVTSLAYQGGLSTAAGASDGLTAGDMICQRHADAAEIGGVWRAWLSSTADDPSSNDAIERIEGDGPWVSMSGAVVFPNRASLMTAPRAGIGLDEFGHPVSRGVGYWTGTSVGGRASSSGTCHGFRDSDAEGTYGATDSTSSTWTHVNTSYCVEWKYLLCFEQQ